MYRIDSTSPVDAAPALPPAVTPARVSAAGMFCFPMALATNGAAVIALIAAATWLAVVTPLWICTVSRLFAALYVAFSLPAVTPAMYSMVRPLNAVPTRFAVTRTEPSTPVEGAF